MLTLKRLRSAHGNFLRSVYKTRLRLFLFTVGLNLVLYPILLISIYGINQNQSIWYVISVTLINSFGTALFAVAGRQRYLRIQT